MARQKGIIKLQGQMGGVSFYKTSEDGFLAREKGGVDADRIKNDPAFERTRENGAEFGRAGAAGKLLRTSLRALILNSSDSRMASRLTREMVKVIQADETNTRGKRNVIDGEAELLQGFEFNLDGKLTRTFFAPFDSLIDRAAGNLSINVPAFVPGNMIAAPQGATHVKLISAGVEIDFETGVYVVNTSQSAEIVIGPQNAAAIALNNAVTPASTKPLFLVFGVEFYQEVNGVRYPLKNGAYNALALVKVDGGV
ncbi:MAG: hypothetical protein KF775_11475 [Cyclobacteriaceae bacterium]|nr:hypothetical protein [Cyclobacteriaceae bacterium]